MSDFDLFLLLALASVASFGAGALWGTIGALRHLRDYHERAQEILKKDAR